MLNGLNNKKNTILKISFKDNKIVAMSSITKSMRIIFSPRGFKLVQVPNPLPFALILDYKVKI